VIVNPIDDGNCIENYRLYDGTNTATGVVFYDEDSSLSVNSFTVTTQPSWITSSFGIGISLVSSYATGGTKQRIALSSDDQIAYIADGPAGLQILDVSNTATPTLLGTYGTTSLTFDLFLSSNGQIVYTADGAAGLQIIDVSNSAVPVLLGTYDTLGTSASVTISSNEQIAYIGDLGSGIKIIDINIPTSTSLLGVLGSVFTPYDTVLSSNDQILYVAGGGAGLQIVDVSTSSLPILLGTYNTPGTALGVTLSSDEQIVYISDGTAGLQILDISNLPTITLLGTYNTPNDANGITLSPDGKIAYVADKNGIVMLDVSNPTNPILILENSAVIFPNDIAISSNGQFLYSADQSLGLSIANLGISLILADNSAIPTTFEMQVTAMDEESSVTDTFLVCPCLNGCNCDTLTSTTFTCDCTGTEFAGERCGNKRPVIINPIDDGICVDNYLLYDGTNTATGVVFYDEDSTLDSFSVILEPDWIASNIILELSILASYGTASNSFDVVLSSDDQIAYVAVGTSGLQIIDISNPGVPVVLGNYDTTSLAFKVTLSSDNQIAYVADGVSGLQIIDVSNTGVPVLLGNYDTTGFSYGVTLSSNSQIAYVADGVSGLQIIDVSNPNSPTLLGSYNTLGNSYDVTLSSDDQIAYIADGAEGLQIINILGAPTLLGSYNTPDAAYGITLSSDDSTVYIADITSVQIIDVTDLMNPVFLSSSTVPTAARSVVLSSNNEIFYIADRSAFLYIATAYITLSIADNSAIPTTFEMQVTAMDEESSVTDTFLICPCLNGCNCDTLTSTTFTCDCTGTQFAGERCGNRFPEIINPIPDGICTGDYLLYDGTNTTTGVIFYDRDSTLNSFSVIVEPDWIASNIALETSTLSSYGTANQALDVTLSSDDQIAYVAVASAGLEIIDVSDPGAPVLLGNYDTTGSATGVTLSSNGQIAYVADGGSGLQIIDVSNTGVPVLLGTFITTGSAQKVALSSDNQIAYVATFSIGLQIIDVSNPFTPSIIGNFNTGSASYDVKLSSNGQMAYVTSGPSGLQIIDVSIPSFPVLLGSFVTSSIAIGVTISSDDQIAYVADGGSGLQIIDVSNPSAPVLLGSFDTPNTAYGITLSSDDSTVYIADITSVQIIDVTDPVNPVFIDIYTVPTSTRSVVLSSNDQNFYSADAASFLYIASRITTLTLVDNSAIPTTFEMQVTAMDEESSVTDTFLICPCLNGCNCDTLTFTTFTCDCTGTEFAGERCGNKRPVIINPIDEGQCVQDYLLYDNTITSTGVVFHDEDSSLSLNSFVLTTQPSWITSSFNVDTSLLGIYSPTSFAYDVTLSPDGQIAYIADITFGLLIVDVSDPTSSSLLGTYGAAGSARAVTLSLDGKIAYVADFSLGLLIINVEISSAPTLLDTYSAAGSCRALTISSDGQIIYIVGPSSGLKIINVGTLPATQLGTYIALGTSYGVTISSDDQIVYVVSGNAGMQILDVSISTVPTQLGTYNTLGTAYGVTLSSDDQIVYVGNGPAGLAIVDVSNAAVPTLLGNYNTLGTAYGVALSSDDQIVYIGNIATGFGLQVIDVRNSALPTLLGAYATLGAAYAVTLSSDNQIAYIADTNAGMPIIKLGISLSLVDNSAIPTTFEMQVTAMDEESSVIETFNVCPCRFGVVHAAPDCSNLLLRDVFYDPLGASTHTIMIGGNRLLDGTDMSFPSTGYMGTDIVRTNYKTFRSLSAASTDGIRAIAVAANDCAIIYFRYGTGGSSVRDFSSALSGGICNGKNATCVAMYQDRTESFTGLDSGNEIIYGNILRGSSGSFSTQDVLGCFASGNLDGLAQIEVPDTTSNVDTIPVFMLNNNGRVGAFKASTCSLTPNSCTCYTTGANNNAHTAISNVIKEATNHYYVWTGRFNNPGWQIRKTSIIDTTATATSTSGILIENASNNNQIISIVATSTRLYLLQSNSVVRVYDSNTLAQLSSTNISGDVPGATKIKLHAAGYYIVIGTQGLYKIYTSP
jgi:hypothetical protein